jgi:hypothetical protein
MIVEKFKMFREGSATRSRVTTRVHSARRSQREPASIPAPTSGREQPSGPGPGSTPYPNRGVAHAPTGSAGCEWRGADGTNSRPQKRCPRSPEVAGATTDPTAWTPWCRVSTAWRIRARAGSVIDANHRGLSRLPSRRQPFRSESRDQREKSLDKPVKFSRRLRGELTASSSGVTVLPRGANTLSAVA